MVESRKWMLVLGLVVWAAAPVGAAPAKAITFHPRTGVTSPAGAVPFDQWITAISAPPIELADGQQFAPTAVLEYCDRTKKPCLGNVVATKKCDAVAFPLMESCLLPVSVMPSDDKEKKGSLIRVDIPPLQYNSSYQMQLILNGKGEVNLDPAALQALESHVNNWIDELAISVDPNPTITEICVSLKEAIDGGLGGMTLHIEAPLEDCAEGIAKPEQIKAIEPRIENAVNARVTLNNAIAFRSNSANATKDIKDAADNGLRASTAKDSRASKALLGRVQQVIQTNTWTPVRFGTAADAKTARMSHISMDAGLVYAPDLDETTTYFGANIYTRPVNTEVSLSSLKAEGIKTWRHRISFTLGATLESIEKDGQRKGIIGSSALVVGVGYRLTDVLRLSVGALVFEEVNPNPLVTNDTSLAVSPYVGFSFDIDVAKQFGKVFPGLP